MTTTGFPVFDLGPLQGLLGKWRGRGHDVAFLPGGMKVESDYIEEMVISPVPVMRITKSSFIHAATYETRLVDAISGEPLHHETGYWAWSPETRTALRIVALGRALGVVASCNVPVWPSSTGVAFKFVASPSSSPPSIATVDLGALAPRMTEFICDVQIDGNAFDYDQITRVDFGSGQPMDHSDRARLVRIP